MKFTEDNVLRVEHRLIKEQLIMECPEECKADLLAYIAGVRSEEHTSELQSPD